MIFITFVSFLACTELSSTYAEDNDGDGFSEFEGDCDDFNRFVHPSAQENCDGIDNDCDTTVDQNAEDARMWYPDNDGDGYGLTTQGLLACEPPPNHIVEAGDCDDNNPEIHQDTVEICDSEGIDENCNGVINENETEGILSEGVQSKV